MSHIGSQVSGLKSMELNDLLRWEKCVALIRKGETSMKYHEGSNGRRDVEDSSVARDDVIARHRVLWMN